MSFARQCRKATDRMQKMAEAVARQSVQDVVADAQKVRARGGRMRVDFGFLRASGGAGLGEMPSGPTSNDDGVTFSASAQVTGMPLAVALAQWDFETPIYWGWSASYARPRESKDAFMRLAAQKWPRFVKANIRRAKRMIR